jgi:hypothetical protein
MGGTVARGNSESGVSVVEVLIASLILTVALLAAGMTMIQGVFAMHITQEQLIAKQKAREALESVFTARSTQNILFDQIRNTGAGGIFTAGYAPVRQMGTDGIANTADDGSEAIETVTLPGDDGLLGTADDLNRPLTDFERRIVISDVLLPNNNVDPDVRRITVDVRFLVRGIWRTVTVSSFISRFA